MTSEDPVAPLRLSKSNTMSSPEKASSGSLPNLPRPLSEISPGEHRRNSPSWNQITKKPTVQTDSSPFQSSPLDHNNNPTSPRMFWQNRSFNSENSFGASPTRRSSIERLQKASRVKNSNIRALEKKGEYDPADIPHVERPLSKIQPNAFGGTGRPMGHAKSQSMTSIPILSPNKIMLPPPPPISTIMAGRPPTPSKDQASPLKSSLSSNRFKSSFDPETGTWSDVSGDERQLPEGKSLHRHAKSVTFDAAPPQVNEYEMATPDLSSIGSNSREGSYDSSEEYDDDHYMVHGHGNEDDSFDASLEDTDKTPVVGPDDWRQTNNDDPFEQSPHPDDLQPPPNIFRNRTDSSASNSESRPLPPLPGAGGQHSRNHSTSSNTAEQFGAHRSLPNPPQASSSKMDLHSLGSNKMSLEERLKLMMLSDDGKSAAEQQRERRMRRAGARGSQTFDNDAAKSPGSQPVTDDEGEEHDNVGELSGLEEYQLPPRISRESILRRVNGNKALFDRDSDYHFSSPIPDLSPAAVLHDPDVAIPTIENDSILDDSDSDSGSVIINRDYEKGYDLYIPDVYQQSETTDEFTEDEHSRLDDDDDDDDSQYSEEPELPNTQAREPDEDQVLTPRASSPVQMTFPTQAKRDSQAEKPVEETKDHKEQKVNEFSRGIEEFMLAKSEEPTEPVAEPEKSKSPSPLNEQHDNNKPDYDRPLTPEQKLVRSLTKPEYDGTGWGESDDMEDYEEEDPGTPESVIHHPMLDSDLEEARNSPAIPEQLATIKSASGSKLKTRPSATPADLQTMREARRHVSREIAPPIPDRSSNRLSRDMDVEPVPPIPSDHYLERHPSFKKRSLTLDLDLGLSLDKDFDRVIEAQKRGYLMRQNTKLVAASDKETEDFRARSAGNSPTKAARPQSWTVEPWNGQPIRKRSKKKLSMLGPGGPVPPLPGQESNAAPATSAEDDLNAEHSTGEDSGERGRLFVKVMGVKDLDLPIPKNERTWFSLTLDNGVHCVTTAWLELARNAPIGQEFELVVPNDLEFQLTLNVKLEKPAPVKKAPAPAPAKLTKQKTSTFSRVFASPKKRKEMEARQKQQEEEERLAAQREAQARQMKAQPTAWDLLSPLAADDGSFARAYVCLKEHESRCFGRPYTVDVAAFNEWALEDAGFASSVKSKRGNMAGNVVRRAPYKIGKLELQLLFVPRPKGATDDDMPKSMNSCIREMKAAEERLARCWEGHLSQQGGDCPYWRRRYFKLVGTKLTAYHEATRQPRATINLANAKRLIDDRRALMEKEILGKGGKRRRSAFAEDEEGYMFVEEGFRIRFNNGELIDFYADTAEDKEGWMRVLGEIIGRDTPPGADSASFVDDGGSKMKSKWCELVLKREETIKKRAAAAEGGGGRRVHSRTKSSFQ
ncbi:putative integrin alpha chain-like protein [Podospora fimiseda]|uniref:Integrin alpha chain-like protein n=1 Tax=Podospora fimiseda TaxID=252190 RepID=A0AAN7BLK3_9PEZI|nr:putative integrin alpha chain-like protein [Podospora fimiseda]